MPSLQLRQFNATQIGKALGRAREILMRCETSGRDDGGQARTHGRLQTIVRILKGQAFAGWQPQTRQGLQIHLWVGFLLGRSRGVLNNSKQVFPIGSDSASQQYRDIDRRGGGGNGQTQTRRMCRFDQMQNPGAQMHLALLNRTFISGGFDGMQSVKRVSQCTAIDIFHVRVLLHPIVTHAFFATRNIQQFGVERHVPMPIQAFFSKGLVEGSQVHHLGVCQCSIDIKNQRFKHQITSNLFIHQGGHLLAERPDWLQSRTQSGCVNHRR